MFSINVTFTHTNSLIVGALHIDGCKRFWGYRSHCNDLFVSLPQEDRVREASFDFYVPYT